MPSVLIVVGGGLGTLKTVHEALTKEPPLSVVVIVDSGRVADLLAYVCKEIKDINRKSIKEELTNELAKLFSNTDDAYKYVLDCMRKKEYVSK